MPKRCTDTAFPQYGDACATANSMHTATAIATLPETLAALMATQAGLADIGPTTALGGPSLAAMAAGMGGGRNIENVNVNVQEVADMANELRLGNMIREQIIGPLSEIKQPATEAKKAFGAMAEAIPRAIKDTAAAAKAFSMKVGDPFAQSITRGSQRDLRARFEHQQRRVLETHP